jgi:molybdate transport system regulatory protein
MDETQHHLRGKLQVDTEFGNFLGDTRIRLLEAIATHGSISQAAKAVPLSYKGAWDALDIMNNLADFPLVVRLTGGRNGGGTTLTDYGRKVVALYRALEDEYQAALDRLAATMKDEGAGDYKEFRKLLKRMSMKASARNQFAGEITALRKGDVDCEVHVRLDAENELVSVITRESAENLGLQIGMDITALVKSSSILLHTDASLKTTARNHLWGEITRIADGAVNAEITLRMPSGKTVCAVLTQSSLDQLGLAVGHKACAVFKASSVILCHYA